MRSEISKIIILWTYTLLTIILSLSLLILITSSTQFLTKKILSPPKPIPFSIHSSLCCAAFPLIILADFPLNLVSSKQQMSTDLYSNIPTSSPELPPEFHICSENSQIYKLTFYDWSLNDSVTRPSSDISLTMYYIFTLESFSPIYAVHILNNFCHFINSIEAKFYDQMPFLMPAGTMMGQSIFWCGTISRWLPNKTEEQFTCPLDRDCILPGIKLVFQILWGN